MLTVFEPGNDIVRSRYSRLNAGEQVEFLPASGFV